MVEGDLEQSFELSEDVGYLARLYLGNILYSLELASLSLEEQGKTADAGFYRGIARKLAEAHGASRGSGTPGDATEQHNGGA
ncbi:MAG: hypothetical protein ABI338_08375 [Gemmatimonadaceae bacterium]